MILGLFLFLFLFPFSFFFFSLLAWPKNIFCKGAFLHTVLQELFIKRCLACYGSGASFNFSFFHSWSPPQSGLATGWPFFISNGSRKTAKFNCDYKAQGGRGFGVYRVVRGNCSWHWAGVFVASQRVISSFGTACCHAMQSSPKARARVDSP